LLVILLPAGAAAVDDSDVTINQQVLNF